MSLWSAVRDFFRPAPPSGPVLRNKPGGMAWINSAIDVGCGEEALVNRVVRTVRIKSGDLWEIDPPQGYTATQAVRFASNGHVAYPGDPITAIAIRDCCLTPIPGVSDDARTEEQSFQPPVPQPKREYNPAEHAAMYPGY